MHKDEKQGKKRHIYITFTHQHRKNQSVYLHIFFSVLNVVQIENTKFVTYFLTWETRVKSFFRAGEGLTLETLAKETLYGGL